MCFVNWPEIDKKTGLSFPQIDTRTFECKQCDSHLYSASERKHRAGPQKRGQGIDFVFDPGLDI